MKTQTKQRIIGGLVLVALLAIFLPMFFSNPHPATQLSLNKKVPAQPAQPQVTLTLPKVVETTAKPAQMATTTTVAKPTTPIKPKQTTATVKAQPPFSKSTASQKAKLAPVKKALWVIQVASYRDVNNAKHMLSQLTSQGFQAYTVTRSDGKLTQVLIGPNTSYQAAVQMQAELKQRTKMTGLVRRQRK